MKKERDTCTVEINVVTNLVCVKEKIKQLNSLVDEASAIIEDLASSGIELELNIKA